MFKSKTPRESGALKLVTYHRNLAKKLDDICAQLDHMESHDPAGKITDEEIQAMRAGALTALTLVCAALGAQGTRTAARFEARCPRFLATKVMDIAASAHMAWIERQG